MSSEPVTAAPGTRATAAPHAAPAGEDATTAHPKTATGRPTALRSTVPDHPGAGASGMRARLVPLALEAALPVAAYYLLRGVGCGAVVAYAGATGVSVARVAVTALRRRRADPLGLYLCALFGLQLLVALLAGDVRAGLAADSVVSGVTGVAFLVSCLRGRPALEAVARRLGRGAPVARPAAGDPAARRSTMTVLTFGCGAVLLAEAGLRLGLLAVLPADTVIGLSRLLQLGTVGGLVGWCAWYGRRAAARRLA